MKPYCCRLNLSNLARALLVADIFRAMIISPVLIGVFFGMACVQVHKFHEEVLPGSKFNTGRVDFFENRKNMVLCIVTGIAILGSDILMALALDKILLEQMGKACVVWLTFATATLLLRNLIYAFIWNLEVELGLHRMDDLTQTVKSTLQITFLICVAYEVVKVLELVVGMAVQREFEVKNRILSEGKKAGEKTSKRLLKLF